MKNSEIASPKLSDDLVDAAREGETELCLSLIAQGADVNRPDSNKNFPLLSAASFCEISMTMLLLAHGADIRVQQESESILHFALDWPLADYVKLISMGADINALTSSNVSPLHYVNQLGHVQALLFAGAHPDTKSICGVTPLSNAIFSKDCSLIELLVNAGADPSAKSAHRSSHLMEAQSQNNLEIASLLIALGAKCKKHQGKNAMWRRLFSLPPLHAAAFGGHTGVALDLIKKGADPNDTFLRKTAAQFAMKSGHSETAAVLHAAEARLAMDQMFSSSNAIDSNTPRF